MREQPDGLVDYDRPTLTAERLHLELHPTCPGVHGSIGAMCLVCLADMAFKPVWYGFFCTRECARRYFFFGEEATDTE